jgi:NAD(P)-dependent dehydrogenase (short-subunit alcohol dehydrogenase family)
MNNQKSQTSVLITGCSKGFGLLFAEQLALKGHKVYATARDLSQAGDLLKLKEQHSNIEVIQLNVLEQADIEKAVQCVSEKENGSLGVLINNAGYGLLGDILDLETSQLEHQFRTNVFAPFALTKQCFPLLKSKDHGGLIINISSVASFLGFPSYGAYSATKAALNNMSMSLASETAKQGISVAVIQPGPFRTEFRESAKQIGKARDYKELRSKFLGTQENPIIVYDLVEKLIQRKLAGKLKAYSEIPIGKDSNLLRILSRCLSHEWLVDFMVKFAT